jgi:hypothetical protein
MAAMKAIQAVLLALGIVSLGSCAATKAVTEPIQQAASGFGQAVGFLPKDDPNALTQLPAAGTRIVQSREDFRNPRNEREAIQQLRLRRQAYLQQIR